MAPKLLLGLVVILLGVTFAAKNPEPVTILYHFGFQYETYLWVVVMASFALGSVIMSLAWGVSSFRAGREKGGLRKKVARLEEELAALKKRPLPDEPPVYPVAAIREKQALAPVEEPKRLTGPEGSSR